MKPIGKIETVGTVQVFGYSAKRVDEHVSDMIYLNYAGPATAADAVWALLIERRALDFTDLAGRPHRLRHGGYPGLEGNEAPFKRFSTRIEHLAIDHCILLDKRFFQPAYDFEVGLTFAFEGDNLAQKVGQHVSQGVDIAVFSEWHAGLLALGRRERLVAPLVNWAHPVYQVTLDRARWTQIIALAVERQELAWPGEAPSPAAERLLTAEPVPEPEQSQTTQAFDGPVSPRAQIAYALHTRQPLLSATLPEHSTHMLSGGAATEAGIAAIRDKIEASQADPSAAALGAPQTIPFTLTHEGDWTWLSFERKPNNGALHRLRIADFRWSQRRRAWYARKLVTREAIERLLA